MKSLNPKKKLSLYYNILNGGEFRGKVPNRDPGGVPDQKLPTGFFPTKL
jgi:hypothetical protein